jgi:small-conductance mechanosensitive channel
MVPILPQKRTAVAGRSWRSLCWCSFWPGTGKEAFGMDALDLQIFGAEVRGWLTATIATLVVFVALRIVKRYVVRHLSSLATGPHGTLFGFVAELVGQTATLVLLAIALHAGALVAVLPGNVERILRTLMVIAVLVQVAVWMNRTASFLLTRYFSRSLDDAARATTITFLAFLVRLALWVIVLLVALDNLGVNVTALVAGLGIGGIAVALATQSILGDIFASLSIVLDRPFVVGDFIVVDALMGRVEHIGLKTTRVRSPSGEEIIFANSELLKSRIRNYRGSFERRVVFSVGVTYDTSHAKLARIPTVIREIIEGQEHARFERAHFVKLAESSLIFEVVYDMLSSDETLFMDIQQAINLALYARFQKEGIELAASHALEVREAAPAILPKSA